MRVNRLIKGTAAAIIEEMREGEARPAPEKTTEATDTTCDKVCNKRHEATLLPMQILRQRRTEGNRGIRRKGWPPVLAWAVSLGLGLGLSLTTLAAAPAKERGKRAADTEDTNEAPVSAREEALARLQEAVRTRDVTAAERWAAAVLPDSRAGRFWQAQAWLLAQNSAPTSEATGLMALLAETNQSLTRFAQAEAALAELAADPTAPFGPEAALTRSAAWAQQGHWTRAVEALAPLLAADPDKVPASHRQEAQCRAAELYLRSGNPTAAAAALEGAPESHERSLLRARVALEKGNPGDAQRLASPVAALATAGPLRATARLVLARARAASGQLLEAQRSLVEWLRVEPETPDADAIVLTLEAIGGLAVEEISKVFAEWTTAPQPRLAAAARFAQAAAQAQALRNAVGRAALLEFAQSHPQHPLGAEARLRAAELALAEADPTAARAALASLTAAGSPCPPPLRFRALNVLAEASRLEGDFASAAEGFRTAGQLAPDPGAARACFLNAAYCGTIAAAGLDQPRPQVSEDEADIVPAASANGPLPVKELIPPPFLEDLNPWPDAAASVLLECGLLAASHRCDPAADFLQRFLETGTISPRRAEAATALAELCLLETPPDLRKARKWLRAARKDKPSLTIRERLDWLELWIEEKDAAFATALEKSNVYLATWPDSPRVPWVRLRRAFWQERRHHWLAAIAEYTTLAEAEEAEGDAVEVPPSLAARAAYLAGLAELQILSPDSLDRAIDHWSTAARLDESVAFAARLQQALAKSRLGHYEEALRQLEALLMGPPQLTPARRTAVLLAQGELYLRPNAASADSLQRAGDAFAKVADDPKAPVAQRAQALCRQGDAMRLLGDKDAAFAFYQKATAPLLTGEVPLSPAASVWPARAGLAAVALLEEKEDWAAAAALAQQLASTPGPHAGQAREKASRLRLEHFLWE